MPTGDFPSSYNDAGIIPTETMPGRPESVLIRDCGRIKDQLRDLNGVVGQIASFLHPVIVDIPIGVENAKAESGPPLSPVAQELEEISAMIHQMKGRLLHLRETIRT